MPCAAPLVMTSCCSCSNLSKSNWKIHGWLSAALCFKIKTISFWPSCSRSAYILRYYMVIIYLPFLRCQPSSAITTIVINEGSIYQPASTRFLFLPIVSPPPLPDQGWLLFLHLFSPPPSILPSIHPSIIPTQPHRGFLCVCWRRLWCCLSPRSCRLPSRMPEVAQLLSINMLPV